MSVLVVEVLHVDEVEWEVGLGTVQVHSADQRQLSANNDDSPQLDWYRHIHFLLVWSREYPSSPVVGPVQAKG